MGKTLCVIGFWKNIWLTHDRFYNCHCPYFKRDGIISYRDRPLSWTHHHQSLGIYETLYIIIIAKCEAIKKSHQMAKWEWAIFILYEWWLSLHAVSYNSSAVNKSDFWNNYMEINTLCKGFSDIEKCIDFFALPGRGCECLNFCTICTKWLIAEKKLGTSQNTGFSILMASGIFKFNNFSLVVCIQVSKSGTPI